MSTSTAMPIQKPAKRRRWWRFALGLLAILIAVPTAWFIWSRLAMEREWAAAVAEAEEDTPRWTLLELEEDRATIPDEENSALFIIAHRPKTMAADISRVPNYDLIFAKQPPNVQLNEQQVQLIRNEFAKIGNTHEGTRKIKDMPRGRFPIKVSDDGFGTLLPNHQDAREWAVLLKHDGLLLAQDRDYDQAIESCRAGLNLSGSMRGEGFLISLLIRFTMTSIAITTLERVLAQGDASDQTLQAMQAALERKYGEENQWLAAIRGERAMTHHFFENVRSGKIKFTSIQRSLGNSWRKRTVLEERLLDFFPTFMLKYYPEHLREMNRGVEIAKLPIHERGPKIEAWDKDVEESKNLVTRLLAPVTRKVHQADVRNHAFLRSAAVAMACERYRLKHKEWPATLDALVQEKLIGAIPTDPIDNQPLRYRRTKEGVVVYSIGIDKTDNGGAINRARPWEPGADIAFRLWDESLRRLPALPPVGIPEIALPR